MEKYRFIDNVPLFVRDKIDQINFECHTNYFPFVTEHTHLDYWEFCLVTKGSIINFSKNDKALINEGMVFISTDRDVHCVLESEEHNHRYFNLIVKKEYAENTLRAISPNLYREILDGKRIFSVPKNELTNIWFYAQNFNHNTNSVALNQKILSATYLRLISHLIYYAKQYENDENPKWVSEFSSILNDTKPKELTVNFLCEKLGYSRAQLNNLFKTRYHLSPSDFLTTFKYNYSINLLMNTNLTISEISEQIGYENPTTYYKTFKKLYKMSPAEYKSKMR
ncbi:MAG: helix-turn-helix transcriptional regulator [Alphaproteobacteria bacterium]|nr:helix-turn-helix transcriptional regulator [Alphaproteobacteria bacterium]